MGSMKYRRDYKPPQAKEGWWGPWAFALALLVGTIVLWHLIGAPQ